MREDLKLIPLEGFEGYYITKEGRVFCDLGKGCRDRSKRVKPYEIKPRPGKTGYLRVCMRETSTNKRKDRYIHRLVAQYFLEPINGKHHVNHKDCNRSNNHVDNLEWCNPKENNDYAMKYGNMTRDKLGRFKHK